MRTLPFLFHLFALFLVYVLPANAQSPQPLPTPPSNFDSTAKRPPNLPPTLQIPPNMHIEVNVWRKKPIHYKTPPDPNSLDLLMDPDLESAVIDRNSQDVHATFTWQENRTSEAFIIHGFNFREIDLRYPQMVVISTFPLDFWLNRQGQGGGTCYDFPGIGGYAPGAFVGTASLNGSSVLVFAPNKPSNESYPEGASACLDSTTLLPLYIDDGIRVFTFTYTPDSNVQINPQGPYLKAIQRQLGHYP